MSIYTVNGQPVKYNNKWLGQDGAPSSDLPSYDSTDAGKILRVNSSGTGLNWDDEDGEQYAAGSGIEIDSTNEISVDTSVVATQSDLTDGLASKQDVLTAGTGISISNDEISVDTSVVATQTDLSGKQDTLTAGQNITIQNNVISATGSMSQVQSDWTESDTSEPSYIQHKPTETLLVAGSNISIVDSVGGVEISAIIPSCDLVVISLAATPTGSALEALFNQVEAAFEANKQVIVKTTNSRNKVRNFVLTNTNSLSVNGRYYHFNCIELVENQQMSTDVIDHWMVVSYNSYDPDNQYNFTVADYTIASNLTSSSFDPFSA